MNESNVARELEQGVAGILANRYGDGSVYLPQKGQRQFLEAAIAGGFVSEEGFVTRKGRNLIATRIAQ
jgi:hypothetical protein